MEILFIGAVVYYTIKHAKKHRCKKFGHKWQWVHKGMRCERCGLTRKSTITNVVPERKVR